MSNYTHQNKVGESKLLTIQVPIYYILLGQGDKFKAHFK